MKLRWAATSFQVKIESLNLNETTFQTAVENVSDYAISLLDRDGKVLTWNAGAQRLTGYPPAEAVGKPFAHCFPSANGNADRPRLLERARADGRFRTEGWFLRKDGARYYADRVLNSLDAARDQATGFLLIACDLTSRKEHESELERRVAQGAAQLQNASKELETFSYSVSHDLRAPLRHIDGFVGVLQDHAAGQLDAEGREMLQTVADSARLMGKMIDDLIAFSRLSRVHFSASPVNLSSVVREVIARALPDPAGRRVEWNTADLPEVPGDRNLLRQALGQLIDNALKFTRDCDPARIEIGALPAADEFIIFIRDNGVGFDMQRADRLFGIFQKLHRAGDFEGSGVGLAMVRRIIHRHGGRTWAESAPDRGATFYFSLPKNPPPIFHPPPT